MARRLVVSKIKELFAALKSVPKARIPVAIRNPDFDRVMSKNLNILASNSWHGSTTLHL